MEVLPGGVRLDFSRESAQRWPVDAVDQEMRRSHGRHPDEDPARHHALGTHEPLRDRVEIVKIVHQPTVEAALFESGTQVVEVDIG